MKAISKPKTVLDYRHLSEIWKQGGKLCEQCGSTDYRDCGICATWCKHFPKPHTGSVSLHRIIRLAVLKGGISHVDVA
jgi:hypothetical protein